MSPLPELATAPSPPEDVVVDTSAHALHAAPSSAVAAQEVVVEEIVKPVFVAPKSIVLPDLTAITQRAQAAAGVGHKITEVAGSATVVEVTRGDAPRFAQPIQPCIVMRGQSCTFSAVVVGDPWPEIAWLKEQEDFAKTDHHKVTADAKTGSCSLTIVDCQQSDTGVYSCRATNVAGRATCTANIVVRE